VVNVLKQRLLLVVIMSFLIMISTACPIQARELTVYEKSLHLLNEVADINMAVYSYSLKPQQQDSYLTISRQTTDFMLSSDKSSLRIRCSFIGDQLQKIYISDNIGEISVNHKAANVLEDAKAFLQRYQIYSNDAAFYGKLQSMLSNVHFENITKVDANIKLDVKVYDQSTDMVWTYVDCFGVEAPVKNVALSYEFGFLKYFVNNWQLYTVAGEPNISREQALDLALEASSKFTYTTSVSGENVSVSNFKVASVGNASLYYLNYKETNLARDSDPFALYPSWFIPLGFDKLYPGGVAGVYVRLWADTGEIKEISPMIVDNADGLSYSPEIEATLDSQSFNNTKFNSTQVITVIIIPVSAVLISSFLFKRTSTVFFKVKSIYK
jgi:hypothetical protein